VTTEQELKLALVAVVVVVDGEDVEEAEALVVGVALVDVATRRGTSCTPPGGWRWERRPRSR